MKLLELDLAQWQDRQRFEAEVLRVMARARWDFSTGAVAELSAEQPRPRPRLRVLERGEE